MEDYIFVMIDDKNCVWYVVIGFVCGVVEIIDINLVCFVIILLKVCCVVYFVVLWFVIGDFCVGVCFVDIKDCVGDVGIVDM